MLHEKFRLLPTLSALALAFLSACGPVADQPPGDAGPVRHEATPRGEVPALEELPLGGDFTLTDHRGEEFHLADLDGQIRLLFFGFASCPDVCPMTLSKLVEVYGLLGEPARDAVTTLFVSVDPERDTPERMATYLGYFDLPTVGLTGGDEQIAKVARQFGASFERSESDSAAGPQISHSAYLYLIDREGVTRYLFRFEDTAEFIAAGLRQLLGDETADAAVGEEPPSGLAIEVRGENFEWTFHYPGVDGELGTDDDVAAAELHVPAGVETTLQVTSGDLVYRFFSTELGINQMAVRTLHFPAVFTAPEPGVYAFRGDQMCGLDHESLDGEIVVQEAAEFARWVAAWRG